MSTCKTQRAVELARGLGTRMRERDSAAALTPEQQQAADAGFKAMMPVNGQPFLAYVLNSIADAGLTDVALVVAPDHDMLRAHFARVPPSRVRLAFVVQPEARGTADAVLAIAPWASGEPFLVMNGDNLYPAAAIAELAAIETAGLAVFDAGDLVATSNIPSERLAAFARADVDQSGFLRSIVEKGGLPPEGGSYWISMNLWRFDAEIFRACREVPRSARGEFELPEAVGLAITRGMRLQAVPARGPVLDLSKRADAADVARRLAAVTPCP